MDLQSLGRKTDLIFARFGGEVVDRGDYFAIKTPSNPGFHWGNYLVFKSPPQVGDLKRWTEIYRTEFDYYENIEHMTFTWDSPGRGNPEEFISAGFHFDTAKVLTATQVIAPPKVNTRIEVRPLSGDDDWEATTNLQVLCRDSVFDEDKYRVFKRRQMEMYRQMSKRGLGNWFGAFLGQTMVGDLGIFFHGTTGRFQNVGTHPQFRRQGICGTLVFQSAQFALRNFGIKTLVMEADADYHAARIYESVGFLPTETNHSLSWCIDRTTQPERAESLLAFSRINIVGTSGSGKSTFARKLAAALRIGPQNGLRYPGSKKEFQSIPLNGLSHHSDAFGADRRSAKMRLNCKEQSFHFRYNQI